MKQMEIVSYKIQTLCVGSHRIGNHVSMNISDNNCIFCHGDQTQLEFHIASITGIQHYYEPHESHSRIIIELNKKKCYDLQMTKWEICKFPSPNYVTLIMEHNIMVDIIEQLNKHHVCKKLIKVGLSGWAFKTPFLNWWLRSIIQKIIIIVELSLCIWTFYQIIYNSDILRDIFSIFAPFFFWLLSPIYFIWSSISETMGTFFRLIILSHFEFVFDLWKIIRDLFKFTYNVFAYMGSMFMKIFSFRKNLPSIKSQFNLFAEIKKLSLSIWEYLIKPIRYVYTLIITPQNGEIARTIRKISSEIETDKLNKQKED